MPKSSKSKSLSVTKLRLKDKLLHKTLMLKSGKQLIERGIPVVVLKPGEKVPATRHGVDDAVKSYTKLKRIVREMDDFNLGAATGDPSGVVVYDIDRRNGGHRSWRKLVSEFGHPGVDLPKVRTGNGFHIYTRVAKAGFTKTAILPGIDVLANRSYALVPPSRHPSGKTYEWIRKLPRPGTVLPKLNRRWIQAARNSAAGKQAIAPDDSDVENEMFREGERNKRLTSLAGKLRRKGQDEPMIEQRLLKANAKLCKPPLPQDEVTKIARSVAKYPDGKSVADPMERLAAAFLKKRYKGGKWLRYEVDDRFWAYDGRIWAVLREKTLERDLLEFMTRSGMGPQTRRIPLVKEVVNYLRVSQAAVDDLLHFRGDPPPVLNLTNGELWLNEDGSVDLRQHSWKSGLRSILQVAYDPKAKCKEYDRALTAIFGKAEDPQAMIDLWDEIVGYIIQARRHIPLILILFGTGGNGKTKLVETIRKLLGEDAVYSGSVHDLGKNRFAFSALFGKLLFVDDDVEQGVRLPDGTLKKISEEKDLTADVKHKEMFNFRSRVVPMLLCNNVPTLSDISPGMRRRLMVIEFKRRFTGKREDKDLFPRIWANELPGILNRALRGHARLQKRGRFEQPKDARAGLAAFLGQANPLTAFVEERCTRSAGGQELLQSLYQAYAEWAKESGITRTLQKLTMKRHLANLGYGSKKTNKGQAILDLKLQG